MTLYFQNHEITIYRNRRIGSSHRFTMSATFTSFMADIQPASADRLELTNGRFGAVFTGFVASTVNIKENDQVLTEDGKRYSVKGVAIFEGAGLLDHKELILVSEDA